MCCTFERRGYLVSSKRMQTVSEFIGYVNNLWGDWHDKSEKQWNPQQQLPWFRGVQKDNYELIPGIYRGQEILGWKYSDYSAGNAENMKADVEDMKAEFARRAVPFSSGTRPRPSRRASPSAGTSRQSSTNVMGNWWQTR